MLSCGIDKGNVPFYQRFVSSVIMLSVWKKKNIQGHSVVRAYLLNFFVILLYLLTAFASIHSNSVLAFN